MSIQQTTADQLKSITPIIRELVAAGAPELPEWCVLTPQSYRIQGEVWKRDCSGYVECPEAVLSAVCTWVMGDVAQWLNSWRGNEYSLPVYDRSTAIWKWMLQRSGSGFEDSDFCESDTFQGAVFDFMRAIHGVVCGAEGGE